MMIRVRKLAAIPLCFGRVSKTSVPKHEPIEIIPSQYHGAINFIGSTNGVLSFMGSTNAFARMVYEYTTSTTDPSLLTSGSPWEDKSSSIIRRSIAQIIQDLCVACYWRTDAGETHGSFSLPDLSIADGRLVIPPSKHGDRMLKDSFQKTIEAIFLGYYLSSPEFLDFMDRVSNVTSKEDYMKLYFHTLLKDKEGRIDFVASSVDWLRSFPPVLNTWNFDWEAEYRKQFQTPVTISAELNKVETINNRYDTFNDMYKFMWRRYSKNNPLVVAIYIRNALRHFNHTRSDKHYVGFESRQWITHKLHDLFSASPFEMYSFMADRDGMYGIKLDMNEEFRGIRRT